MGENMNELGHTLTRIIGDGDKILGQPELAASPKEIRAFAREALETLKAVARGRPFPLRYSDAARFLIGNVRPDLFDVAEFEAWWHASLTIGDRNVLEFLHDRAQAARHPRDQRSEFWRDRLPEIEEVNRGK